MGVLLLACTIKRETIKEKENDLLFPAPEQRVGSRDWQSAPQGATRRLS